MPRAILVDTSAWIEAMRRHGDEILRERVRAVVRETRARFCDLVRLELWNGIGGGAERRWLSKLERVVETVPIDDDVWSTARELARAARERGLTVPATDIVVAACAQVHDLELLHRDAHFERLAELSNEEEGND